jgi:hypothetical protein
MATVKFDEMVDDISPFLPGCPSPVIARTAQKVVTDLCQRGKVWQAALDPVSFAVGEYTFTLEPPEAYAVITDIVSGHTIVDGQKRPLTWTSMDAIERHYPTWPEDNTGQPQLMTWSALNEFALAPTPLTAGTLHLQAKLRPAPLATEWDADLYAEFQRAIFHGVLFDLQMMSDRGWSDQKAAAINGRIWTHLLAAARARANHGYNITSLSAEMRPFA